MILESPVHWLQRSNKRFAAYGVPVVLFSSVDKKMIEV